MEDSLILQLSGCSPSTPSPQPRNTCRLVPLLATPAKASEFENLNSSFQKNAKSSVLQGVVAYVDVRSESDNRSRAVGYELQQLGATVVDRFSDDVTHLVYKDGKKRTLDMALRRKIQLVSVLWVESCKQNRCKVAEDEFRVMLPKKQTPIGPIKFKRYKSMQPKSFDEEVVLSEEKVRRRQQRKDKTVKMRLLKTPESGQRRNFFVAETCRRSPTRDELVTPTSICVPDTPPSMRRHLEKTQSTRRAFKVPSPHLSLLANPLQRKFSFDRDDTSPEVVSLSSGSHSLSHSSQYSSHPSDIAPSRSSITTSRAVVDGASGSAVQSVRVAFTESLSPEIEIQTAKSLPRLSSSFDSEKKEFESKISDCKPGNNDLKSSPVKPGFEKPSGMKRVGLGLILTRMKRTHSPSIEEATSASKRQRVDENVKGSETISLVSMIPLSQLGGKSSSEASGRKTGHGNVREDDSENLSETAKVSPIIRTENRKSFVRSSPTSSQEASRNHNNGTLLTSLTKPVDLHLRDTEQCRAKTATGLKRLAAFSKPNVEDSATPCNRPPICADSLVLETRVRSKRRSLIPFCDTPKTDVNTTSRRKTLMSRARDSDADNRNGPILDGVSPQSKVVLQRLPGAWDLTKSLNSDKSMPVTRKVLSESAGVQSKAGVSPTPNNRPKKDVGKRTSKGVDVSISPAVRQPKRNGSKSYSNGVDAAILSPSANRPVRDAGKSKSSGVSAIASPQTKRVKRDSAMCNANDGVNTAISNSKQTKGNAESYDVDATTGENFDLGEIGKIDAGRQIRRTGKGKKIKKSSSASSNSSNEFNVKCSMRSIVITSLHRNEQKIVSDIVQTLGSCVLSENISEQTTHVVAGGNRRTVKVLAGISRGLWILSLDWVKRSAEKGMWLPEEQFELTEFFPAAKLSRLERERWGSDYRHDLFSEVGDVFVAEGSAPPKEELEQLISVCQGKITKQLRTAAVCVGKFLRQSITNVSEKWILDCITQHECLPTTEYILNA